MPLTCPSCERDAVLVGGHVVYPHRPDLQPKKFWACLDCSTWVGCHPGTTEPLGTLAGSELRALRWRAHEKFDRLWRSGLFKRAKAYAWLSGRLGLQVKDTHIGSFDAETCRRVIELATSKLAKEKR